MKISILGLTITSSWGNGHATTYRSLVRGLRLRGHEILFLERDQPWYAETRDLASPSYCRVGLYSSLSDLISRYERQISASELVIVGSYVPEGSRVIEWISSVATGYTAFYDIDTPITLAGMRDGGLDYLSPSSIPDFDLYLSFTGGPVLRLLEREYGAAKARVLYCSVDPDRYFPESRIQKWKLGYLGTWSEDRQPGLEELLFTPARQLQESRFIVAGPLYPDGIDWPPNVRNVHHLDPSGHRAFYNSQEFTLNVTRDHMRKAGYSPSVRLFEAAACGVPIISDDWPGLESVLVPGKEILVARDANECLRYLRDFTPERRREIGLAARERIVRSHTADHRAAELEVYCVELFCGARRRTALTAL